MSQRGDNYFETSSFQRFFNMPLSCRVLSQINESDFDDYENIQIEELQKSVPSAINALTKLDEEEEIQFFDDDVTEMEQKLVSALAVVGIRSNIVEVKPEFCPHGREMNLLVDLGDFYFEGNVVEEWFFPTLGAERFMKNKLKSTSVLSTQGIVGTVMTSNVIDAARKKLDGFEVITFGISTIAGRFFFEWSDVEIKQVDDTCPSLCEKVYHSPDLFGLYLLNGKKIGAINHTWEFLTQELVDGCGEGLIVRMAGREYRIPEYMNATLQVKRGIAYSGCGRALVHRVDQPDGLYDFQYLAGEWSLWKVRRDKLRADTVNGIQFMLDRSVTLAMFQVAMVIPVRTRKFVTAELQVEVSTPEVNKVAIFSKNKAKHQIYLKRKKEYVPKIQGDGLMAFEVNVLRISGMKSNFKRCFFRPFVIRGSIYTRRPLNQASRLIYLENREVMEYSVVMRGRNCLRCYKTDINTIKYTYIRNGESRVDNVRNLTIPDGSSLIQEIEKLYDD